MLSKIDIWFKDMENKMKLVVIESPLAGDFNRNIRYARLCALDCLQKGEAPYASHLFFPQMLDDEMIEERELGIKAGFAWANAATKRVVYDDFGMSGGMQRGITHGREIGQEIEYRKLPKYLMDKLDVADDLATRGVV
jgi:hypothetical protein